MRKLACNGAQRTRLAAMGAGLGLVLLTGCKPAPPPVDHGAVTGPLPHIGLAVEVTAAERKDGRCVLLGVVHNYTARKLTALGLENQTVVADLAPQASSPPATPLISKLVTGDERCMAVVAPFQSGLKLPWISDCALEGEALPDCKREVNFSYALDLSGLQAADAKALGDFDAARKDDNLKSAHRDALPRAAASLQLLLERIAIYAKPKEIAANAGNPRYNPSTSPLNDHILKPETDVDNPSCASPGPGIPAFKRYIAQFRTYYGYASPADRDELARDNAEYFTDRDLEVVCRP